MEQTVTIRGRSFRVHASSLSFAERCARAAMAASSAFRNESYWRRVGRGRVEAGTFSAIEAFLEPGGAYVDIGAWVGAMTLYAAALGGRCFAAEPDPVAYAQLDANVSANPELARRIVASNVAIWNRSGPLPFGTASSLGDSQSSALYTRSSQTLTVPAMTIEDLVERNRIGRISFLKMDIEGGETVLLPAMRRFLEAGRPALYLSLHPAVFPDPRADGERIIEALGCYRHLWSSDGRPIDGRRLRRRIAMKLNYDLVAADRPWPR